MWKPWRRSINTVESLFVANIDRINKMKFAGLTTSVCLLEIGHMLFAKIHKLTIQKAWFAPIDWFFDPSTSYPGVQIANVGSNEAKFHHYMGGLLGDVNAINDDDTGCADRRRAPHLRAGRTERSAADRWQFPCDF